MVFPLARCEEKTFRVVFVGGLMCTGICFWECSYPPLVHVSSRPEFHDIIHMDKVGWPWCLLWHGWLPSLSGCERCTPWACEAAAVVKNRLETALGSYVATIHDLDGDIHFTENNQELAAAPFIWSGDWCCLVWCVCGCFWRSLVAQAMGSSGPTRRTG